MEGWACSSAATLTRRGLERSLHAKREDSAYLNQYLSFSALDERRAPERSDEAQSEA